MNFKENIKNKKIIIFILLFLSISFLTLLFWPRSLKLKKIRLNEVTRSVFYAPQYVAFEMGFFRDEELNIELTTSAGSDQAMTSILSRHSDVALLGPEAAVYVYKEGKKNHAVVFAGLTKKDGMFVVGNDEKFSWENLNNKKVIVGRKGGMPAMVFKYVVDRKNIKTQTLDNVRLDAKVSTFLSGNSDYVTLLEPTATELSLMPEGPRVLASIGMETEKAPYTVYAANKTFFESEKKLLQKFTNALYKAQVWVYENSSENIAKVISPYFVSTNLDILAASINRYKQIDVWANSPVISEKSVDFLQEVMINAGELENKLDLSQVFNNSLSNHSLEYLKNIDSVKIKND